MKKNLLLLMIFIAVKFCSAQSNWQHGQLQVTADGRDLQFADGTPFFWLGDTGWELFHRLNKKEVAKYLDNRRRKGFTIIQAVALAEFEGLRKTNQYGDLPLHNGDPNQPNEKYFQWIDTVITMAKQRDLFIGLLPAWGDGVTGNPPGIGKPVFNTGNAYTYGKWIAQRYADYPNTIWILGATGRQ